MRKKISRPFYDTFFQVSRDAWHEDCLTEAAEELRTRHFFKRFSVEDIVKFLPKMKIGQQKPKSILFVETHACIIIQGMVNIRNHNRTKGGLTEIKAKCCSGDILGLDEIDGGLSTNSDSWNMVMSDIEVVWMEKADARALWNLQYTN